MGDLNSYLLNERQQKGMSELDLYHFLEQMGKYIYFAAVISYYFLADSEIYHSICIKIFKTEKLCTPRY